ncbi:MAG TPA: GNAT family N-acetyltransferase [Micropepsaceae bacterium]|nr:GNAT family N-acetyltransferase [Micropepsaceae bacterium]
MIGWIGAIESYGGHAWELHPLAVHPESQRQGVGSALLSALEIRAAADGAVTLFGGTDDGFGGTNLFGCNLYPEPLEALKKLRAASGHPSHFTCAWALPSPV